MRVGNGGGNGGLNGLFKSLFRARGPSIHSVRAVSTYHDDGWVLESLLRTPLAHPPSFYVEQTRHLKQRQLERPTGGQRVAESHQKPLEVDPGLRALVTQPALSTRDLQTHIERALKGVPPFETRTKVHEVLLAAISVASANSLRTFMLYLAKYWQSGILGVRPLIREARAQTVAILDRALQTNHPTTWELSSGRLVEQIGAPDVDKFERLAQSLTVYMELYPRPGEWDTIDDRLLQLFIRNGSFEAAQSRLRAALEDGLRPSSAVLDEYVSTLSRRLQAERRLSDDSMVGESIRKEILAIRPLLVGVGFSPRSARFLLEEYVDSPDEFWGLLELVSRSASTIHILEECQAEFLAKLAAVHSAEPPLQIMALMFGFLDRLHQDNIELNAATLSTCVELASRFGNAAAVAHIEQLRT